MHYFSGSTSILLLEHLWKPLFKGLPIVLLIFSVSASAKNATLVVLGDSISAAYGMPLEQGWVHLMAQRFSDRQPPIKVVNASVSGDSTATGLARLPELLKIHQPQWLIVELGGNDGLRGYPPTVLTQNLSRIIELAQQVKTQVLMLGMRLPPNYGQAYNQALAQSFVTVTQQYQIPLMPFFLEQVALKPGAMQKDGIHPSAEAQPWMLESLWPCLTIWLQGDIPKAIVRCAKSA